MLEFSSDESEQDEGPRVWIVEDRPPLREGKVFVNYERATIAENLGAAYVGPEPGIPRDLDPKALDRGQVREYWEDGDIDKLETLTLEASAAVERASRALPGLQRPTPSGRRRSRCPTTAPAAKAQTSRLVPNSACSCSLWASTTKLNARHARSTAAPASSVSASSLSMSPSSQYSRT